MLELDDGTHLTQSNAILWYLAEGTPFLPATTLERAQVVQWLMFEQESIVSGIAAPRFWLMTGRGDERTLAARQERGRQALIRLDEHLRQRNFLLDNLSIADIAAFAYTHVAPDAGFTLGDFPAVTRWLARLESRPQFINDFIPYPANALPAVTLGLVGGGGSTLPVPVLVYVFGEQVKQAISESLLIVGTTALVGAIDQTC